MQAHWHSPTSTISPPQTSIDRPRGTIVIESLEAQLLASVGGDAALDAARAELGVRVRDAREGSLGGRVLGAAEADVVDDGVSDHVAVGRVDGLGAAVLEDGRLDQELGAHAGVDAGVNGREVAAVRGESCVVSRLVARKKREVQRLPKFPLYVTYLKMWPVPNRKDGARELMLLQ